MRQTYYGSDWLLMKTKLKKKAVELTQKKNKKKACKMAEVGNKPDLRSR